MANSRILPSSTNPYGGSSVVVDSSPYTQYFLNQQAKQQAKDEALDNYFKSIDQKINPAGMRTQEIPALIQQQNADRQFYLENKDRIKNPSIDNGKAYNEYIQRNQAKLGFIEQSKNLAKKYNQLVPIFADPSKRALMNDETFQSLHKFDLPINDPNHQDFNVESLNYNPKPFDTQKYRTSLTPFVKESPGEVTFENNPDYQTSFLRTPKTKMVQNYDKMQLAQRAEDEYSQNPSYRALINQIADNPTQYKIHNDIYKKAFGTDLDIQHPEEIAIAHTLSLLPKDYLKSGKPEIDQVAFDKFKNARNYKQSLNKIAANKVGQQNGATEGNLLDTFGSTQTLRAGDKTITNGVVTDKDGNAYNGELFITKDYVPSSIYSVLKASGLDNDALKFNKGFVAVIKDGRIQALKDKKLGLIDRTAIENAQLKFNTEPQKGKQPNFGKPVTETKTFVFPSGKKKF